jgi:hypothetical protein
MTERKRGGAVMIARRHVIYVEGYDPQGAEGYYRLFKRSWNYFLALWPLQARLGELQLDSQAFAHWDIEASGPNWRAVTRYDFLRQEHIIRANMAEPLLRQIPRALGWAFDYLVSGAIIHVLRASWEFGLVLIYFQLMLVLWIALALGGGALVALAVERAFAIPGFAAFAVGPLAALAVFLALRPLANRWFIIQINNHWPHLCEFARGQPSCFDAPIEACAMRLVEAARAGEADEIVVVGHSGGGALAPAVVMRALELDTDVGRRGPAVVLLTLGSIAPGAALHPRAERLRAVFARIAVEPSVVWIDAQSRRDVLNFWDFDPIQGIGVRIGSERCNPIIWKVRVRGMLLRHRYRWARFNFVRLHYQFIMANDRRAPYDYFMLICSPLPVATLVKNPTGVAGAFGADASLGNDRATSPAAAAVTPATGVQ